MRHRKFITILTLIIVVFGIVATTVGIFSRSGTGPYQYASIRGREVTIYGKGVYRHMSAEVAPQGIAQDYVTLFIAVPLMIYALILSVKGSHKGKVLLAGSYAYFLVTYLFYTVMAMYNALFLVYVVLMGAAFYGFILCMLSFDARKLYRVYKASTPYKLTGNSLLVIAMAIALLWLGVVLPPLVDGSVVPHGTDHYTTLIVQGLDLGILLPAAFISGWLWKRKHRYGLLLAPVYFVFLSILMTALTAKIIAMGSLGYNIIPAVFIIPLFQAISIFCTYSILKNVSPNGIYHGTASAAA